jgi:hypothetical protein
MVSRLTQLPKVQETTQILQCSKRTFNQQELLIKTIPDTLCDKSSELLTYMKSECGLPTGGLPALIHTLPHDRL